MFYQNLYDRFPVFLPVSHVDWYLVHPGFTDNTSLPLLKDENLLTCETMNFSGNDYLMLKAAIGAPFKSLEATIVVSNNKVFFGPNTEPINCGKPTSLLMTHDSSQAADDGQTCGLFCVVPTTCRLEGMETLSNGLMKYNFSCRCIQQSCNELIMQLRPGISQQDMAVCEILETYSQVWTLLTPRYLARSPLRISIIRPGQGHVIQNCWYPKKMWK